jgi:hypothetical protein
MNKEEFLNKLDKFLDVTEEYRKTAKWYEKDILDSLIDSLKTTKLHLLSIVEI